VYVDNLTEAIMCALEAPQAAVQGEVFTISDGDAITWRDYYGYFAERLGVSVPTGAVALSPKRQGLLRWVGAWLRGLLDIATSTESKSLVKKILHTEPTGSLPRLMLEGTPGLEAWLRRRFGMDQPPLYRRPGPAEPAEPIVVTGRLGCICIDKARKVLSYEPIVPPTKALELTWQWARHARLVT
jgi:nucleoside-diphosphate-sugar epimerase